MIRYTAVALVVFFLIVSGCKETAPTLKGTIKGQVQLIQESEWPVKGDGVLITLEGSDPLITGITDENGEFEIGGIPTGTYNVVFSKNNYSEDQVQGFDIVGGDAPLYLYHTLVEIPSATVKILSIEIDDSHMRLGIQVDNYSGLRSLSLSFYLHTLENPSHTNYRISTESGCSPQGELEGYECTAGISNYQYSFESGDTVHVVAYPSLVPHFGYYDVLQGKIIHTALGQPSNVASIVIP